ncbi:MAG TPA: PEP-CTERM sorting domain-containing protein, partial [Pirellulales bacterium]|nr:PEP-CTERM sorting domain-containing protein [Pirellulales bacterium]
TSPAVPASSGTYVHIYDLYAGDPSYPGASAGDVYIYGNTSFQTGFGVSLYYYHELEKDIYLAADSTQTYGEYGFAFDVLVHFASNGMTLDTGPLYDVFALDTTTDPDNPGGFATFAPFPLQDAATEAIYAALVPEPSSFLLALIGGGLLIAHRSRRKGGSD